MRQGFTSPFSSTAPRSQSSKIATSGVSFLPLLPLHFRYLALSHFILFQLDGSLAGARRTQDDSQGSALFSKGSGTELQRTLSFWVTHPAPIPPHSVSSRMLLAFTISFLMLLLPPGPNDKRQIYLNVRFPGSLW